MTLCRLTTCRLGHVLLLVASLLLADVTCLTIQRTKFHCSPPSPHGESDFQFTKVRGVVGQGGSTRRVRYLLSSSTLTKVPLDTTYKSSGNGSVKDYGDQEEEARGFEASSATCDSGVVRGMISTKKSAGITINRWAENVAPKMWEDVRGVDVRYRWREPLSLSSTRGAADSAAENIVLQILDQQRHLGSKRNKRSQCDEKDLNVMRAQLSEAFLTFSSFCKTYIPSAAGCMEPCNDPANSNTDSKMMEYTARIVSTRGSASTKCPIWHLDHVPVRWIQAFAGPGCMWVQQDGESAFQTSGDDGQRYRGNAQDNNGVRWDRVNALDADDALLSAEERNSRIVQSHAVIKQAQEGEAVIMIGNRFHEFARHSGEGDAPSVTDNNGEETSRSSFTKALRTTRAGLHKSPDRFLPWQGRVLLTIDVTVPGSDD